MSGQIKLILLDFDSEFEVRLGPAAAAQEFSLVAVGPGEDLPSSSEEEADLFLVALSPGVSRFRRLREIKGRGHAAVVVVAERPDHVDSVVALELGADDYLPKDCEPRELLACVRAVLRLCQARGAASSPQQMEIDGIALDLGSREAFIEGTRIELTTSEFEILRILMSAAGKTVPRDELGRLLTKREVGRLERALDVHISHLRHKLGDRRDCIKTVRGTGYQFVSSSADESTERV